MASKHLKWWQAFVSGILLIHIVRVVAIRPHIVEVGKTARLRCVYTPPDRTYSSITLKWRRFDSIDQTNGKLLAYSVNFTSVYPIYQNYNMSVDGELIIYNVTMADDAIYECRVTYEFPSGEPKYWDGTDRVQLNVHSGIGEVLIYEKLSAATVSPEISQQKTVICKATGCAPSAVIDWIVNGSPISNDDVEFLFTTFEEENGDGEMDTISELIINKRYEHAMNVTVKCIASHNSNTSPAHSQLLVLRYSGSNLVTYITGRVSQQTVTTTMLAEDEYKPSVDTSINIQRMPDTILILTVTGICTFCVCTAICIAIVCVLRSRHRSEREDGCKNAGIPNPNLAFVNNNTLNENLVIISDKPPTTHFSTVTEIDNGNPVTKLSSTVDDQTTTGPLCREKTTTTDTPSIENAHHVSQSCEHQSSVCDNQTEAEEPQNLVDPMIFFPPIESDNNVTFDDAVSLESSSSSDSDEERPLEPLRSGYITTEPFEIPRSDIQILNDIGEGYFGKVFKGLAKLRGQTTYTTVAIKTLKEKANDLEYEELKKELRIMKTLPRHPFVVSLLACCTLPRNAPNYVVVEFVENGNLKDYLTKNAQQKTLSETEFLKFSRQIAEGMRFLHEHDCIHRDLAARNILLDQWYNCKITDFGMARCIKERQIYEKLSDGAVPVCWMSPESLSCNIYTKQSDVWSFGIVLYEIVTYGSRPYSRYELRDVRLLVSNGHTMTVPEKCNPIIRGIMKECWAMDPLNRPTFISIVQRLHQNIET